MSKILWVVVSCLMALSLVLAACAPAATTTTPTTPTATATTTPATTTPTSTTTPSEKEQVSSDKPKYGGTITFSILTDPTSFDSGAATTGGALLDTVYQQFTAADWTRGLAGIGVTNFAAGPNGMEDYGNQIAESWAMPSLGVWVLQIRQGMHWQPINSDAGRLMASRQVTADDIVTEFKRMMSKSAWINVGHSDVSTTANITKTGPWEVTITTPVNPTVAWQWIIQGAGFYRIYPPEVIAKYGNMQNWRNAVGTGPFMLTDYVPGSQFVFARNPVYWEKDPQGPGKSNQLPYADALRQLIIPDLSTTQAAMRTGKLDLLLGVTAEDWKAFQKTTPKLESTTYITNNPWVIAMRQDKKDKPFSDIRVRQALMYATDFNSWVNDYYGGNAVMDVHPVNKQVNIMYQPLSEMPQSVQNLFVYNPDKARQLLKEAGYPNGFKASIVINGNTTSIDELSVFKAMWAKVGVELNLDVRDQGTYVTMSNSSHAYEDMLYQLVFGSFTIQMTFGVARDPALNNPSHINEFRTVPFVEDLFAEYSKHIFTDWPGAYTEYKKMKPWLLENAFVIPRPSPYTYSIWWPWLKNYYGQGPGFVRYAWVDQDLKKSMGY